MTAREKALDEIAGRLEAAFNAKDAAALASLYSETATFMPPNGTVRIVPEAFQVGTFTSVASGESPNQPNRFKYVLILKRVGPQWQIEYDIWNGDQ
jgi:ketosteroid isomerase-like protein